MRGLLYGNAYVKIRSLVAFEQVQMLSDKRRAQRRDHIWFWSLLRDGWSLGRPAPPKQALLQLCLPTDPQRVRNYLASSRRRNARETKRQSSLACEETTN
jgi:hypothetical protein